LRVFKWIERRPSRHIPNPTELVNTGEIYVDKGLTKRRVTMIKRRNSLLSRQGGLEATVVEVRPPHAVNIGGIPP